MEKGIFSTLFGGIMSLLVLILLVISLNAVVDYVDNSIFQGFVVFFNSNVILLVWIALVMIVAEILFVLKFPFNLPGPCFNAVGGFLIVSFLGNLFVFLNEMGSLNWGFPLKEIFFMIAIFVLLIILIVGYYNIFKNMPRGKNLGRKEERESEGEEESEEPEEDEEQEAREKKPVKRAKPVRQKSKKRKTKRKVGKSKKKK